MDQQLATDRARELLELGLAEDALIVLCTALETAPRLDHFQLLRDLVMGDGELGLDACRPLVSALVRLAVPFPVRPRHDSAEPPLAEIACAADVLSALRQRFPSVNELYLAEAMIRRRLPDRAHALEVAEMAATLFPEVWACQTAQATALQDAQRLDDSLPYVRRALALDPSDGAPLHDAGWAFLRLGRPREAEALFSELAQRWEGYPGAAHALELARQAARIS